MTNQQEECGWHAAVDKRYCESGIMFFEKREEQTDWPAPFDHMSGICLIRDAVLSLTAWQTLCYSKCVPKNNIRKENIVRKAVSAWELLFVVHVPVIRGSKSRRQRLM